MHQSFAPGRNKLLVDIEHGTVLSSPTEDTVSERWVDSHPFIRRDPKRIYAGPEAAIHAVGGTDFVTYEIIDKFVGQLYLRRVA